MSTTPAPNQRKHEDAVPNTVKIIVRAIGSPSHSPDYRVFGLVQTEVLPAWRFRAACRNAKPDTLLIAVYLEMVPLTPTNATLNGAICPMAARAILAAAAVNAALYGASLETVSLGVHVHGPALIHLAERYGNATILLALKRMNRIHSRTMYKQ